MGETARSKNYWRRRRYKRLDETGEDQRIIRLGGKRKHSWKPKSLRKIKLRFKVLSPSKIIRRIRDAYVNMMLRLEGKLSAMGDHNIFGARRITPKAKKGRSNKASKEEEFQNRLIFEIYKSLKASQELAAQ
ncbi:hypothetical protein ACHQM5_005631 [Ranunculus cassubicifolius]